MFSFILRAGIRYGSCTAPRTDADQYALVSIDGELVPCRIIHHLQIQFHDNAAPVLCSVVRRMVSDDRIPSMPWDL